MKSNKRNDELIFDYYFVTTSGPAWWSFSRFFNSKTNAPPRNRTVNTNANHPGVFLVGVRLTPLDVWASDSEDFVLQFCVRETFRKKRSVKQATRPWASHRLCITKYNSHCLSLERCVIWVTALCNEAWNLHRGWCLLCTVFDWVIECRDTHVHTKWSTY